MDNTLSDVRHWAVSVASKSDLPPAVLLDMGLPGLGLARHLGRDGVPVVCLDTKPNDWSHRTRYAHVISSDAFEDEDFLLECIEEIFNASAQKPVVFPLHDDFSILVAENQDRLKSFARVPGTSDKTLISLVEKSGTAAICAKAGISTPVTVSVSKIEDLDDVVRQCRFPCLIKPNESRRWQTDEAQKMLRGRKVVTVRSPEHLEKTYTSLAPITPDVIVQEEIPGPDENLMYVASYIDTQGRPFGLFVGQKLRSNPPHYGRGCWVRSCENEEVSRLTEDLVRETGYRGSIGVEFKYDSRDKRYKLIEVNCRFGLWDAFAESCGIPIASAAYRDLGGLPVPDSGTPKSGKYWLYATADIQAGIQQMRKKSMTLFQWAQAYVRPHFSATFAWDDPLPALVEWREFLLEFLAAVRRRLLAFVS